MIPVAIESPVPRTAPPALPPAYARKSTGLVRQVSITGQSVFAASGNPFGFSLVITLFALTLFPRSNFYIAMAIALVCGLFAWVTFALLSAMMPRVGGDYAFVSRILNPALGLGSNLAFFVGSMMAAGLWSYWVAEQGLSPVLTVIGAVTRSQSLTSAGASFGPTHQVNCFLVAAGALLLMSLLAALGTRVAFRVVTALFMIAAAGFVIDILVLALTSHGGFVSRIDRLAGHGSYAKTVAKGSASLLPTNGYSAKSTVGAAYYCLSNTVFCWVGAYTIAEFRGAGQRKRQLQTMVGTGTGQIVLILIAAVIFLHTVGYSFFISALGGNFTGPGGSTVGLAGYVYFAGLATPGKFLVVILSFAFMGWWLPGLWVNLAMAQRALLSYSFDGLLPKRVAYVNPRTHTPLVAIAIVAVGSLAGCAWVSFSSSFFKVLGIMLLLSFVPMIFVGIAAISVKRRRPDLYKGSPAEWRIAGIEMLPVAGAGCLVVGVAAIATALYFHSQLAFNIWVAGGLPFAILAIGFVWYAVARSVRRRGGVDLDLVYRTIPPE
jgi:APA family basic amino acid/polyamine antiporter